MITKFLEKVFAEIKVTADPPESVSSFASKYGGTEANLDSVVTFINKTIEVAFALAGVIALFMFLYGGVAQYVFSFGNEEQIKKASQTMLWSFLGLVIIAASYTILSRVTSIFK